MTKSTALTEILTKFIELYRPLLATKTIVDIKINIWKEAIKYGALFAGYMLGDLGTKAATGLSLCDHVQGWTSAIYNDPTAFKGPSPTPVIVSKPTTTSKPSYSTPWVWSREFLESSNFNITESMAVILAAQKTEHVNHSNEQPIFTTRESIPSQHLSPPSPQQQPQTAYEKLLEFWIPVVLRVIDWFLCMFGRVYWLLAVQRSIGLICWFKPKDLARAKASVDTQSKKIDLLARQVESSEAENRKTFKERAAGTTNDSELDLQEDGTSRGKDDQLGQLRQDKVSLIEENKQLRSNEARRLKDEEAREKTNKKVVEKLGSDLRKVLGAKSEADEKVVELQSTIDTKLAETHRRLTATEATISDMQIKLDSSNSEIVKLQEACRTGDRELKKELAEKTEAQQTAQALGQRIEVLESERHKSVEDAQLQAKKLREQTEKEEAKKSEATHLATQLRKEIHELICKNTLLDKALTKAKTDTSGETSSSTAAELPPRSDTENSPAHTLPKASTSPRALLTPNTYPSLSTADSPSSSPGTNVSAVGTSVHSKHLASPLTPDHQAPEVSQNTGPCESRTNLPAVNPPTVPQIQGEGKGLARLELETPKPELSDTQPVGKSVRPQ